MRAKTVAQEASDSIQIGVDQERMAAVSATDALVPTESDSAPRWLSNCPKDGAGGFIIEKAWAAAIESAHGQGYGDINVRHRGINATLKVAKRYFESTGWAIPNDARSSVTDFIGKCITVPKE